MQRMQVSSNETVNKQSKLSSDYEKAVLDLKQSRDEKNDLLHKMEELNQQKDIIEHLWKVIISDDTVDQYESNLMRRVCGLIYFPDKQ